MLQAHTHRLKIALASLLSLTVLAIAAAVIVRADGGGITSHVQVQAPVLIETEALSREQLLGLIASNEPSQRTAALDAWHSDPKPHEVQLLIALLEHADPMMRTMAAELLGELGGDLRVVAEALVKAADDEDEMVATRAIWSLGASDSPRVRDTLDTISQGLGFRSNMAALALSRSSVQATSDPSGSAAVDSPLTIVSAPPGIAPHWVTRNGLAIRMSTAQQQIAPGQQIPLTIELLNVRPRGMWVNMRFDYGVDEFIVEDDYGIPATQYRLRSPGSPIPPSPADSHWFGAGERQSHAFSTTYHTPSTGTYSGSPAEPRGWLTPFPMNHVQPGTSYYLAIKLVAPSADNTANWSTTNDVIDGVGWFGTLRSASVRVELLRSSTTSTMNEQQRTLHHDAPIED